MVMRSLDREARASYNIKVKAEQLQNAHRVGKREARNSAHSHTHTHTPAPKDQRLDRLDTSSYHLAFDEALVVINVGDENDNGPVFDNKGKPVVAAVPLEASFGYQVVKLTVRKTTTTKLRNFRWQTRRDIC